MASRLLAKGTDLDSVQQLLGHAEFDHIKPYLEVSKEKLIQAFSDVL
jgi:site-specific recombinase XerD